MSASDRIEQQVAFLLEADRMKHVLRQNPLVDGTRRENDAEHSWHLALCAMVFYDYAQPRGIDLGHVLQMAIVHDLVEVYAGDTFAYDAAGYADKAAREQQAAARLYGLLPEDVGARLRALWEEFEACATPESRYAAAMDRLMPLLHNQHTQGTPTWVTHGVHAAQVRRRMEPIRTATPELWPLVEGIIAQNVQNGRILPD